jgi:hypothetical protein
LSPLKKELIASSPRVEQINELLNLKLIASILNETQQTKKEPKVKNLRNSCKESVFLPNTDDGSLYSILNRISEMFVGINRKGISMALKETKLIECESGTHYKPAKSELNVCLPLFLSKLIKIFD